MTSKYPDPLVQPLDPDRVAYANGVLLDETDFRDEQTYIRARLARALGYLHGHGTVAGLNVEVITREVREEGRLVEDAHVLVVRPGLAVDRLGRLIEVSESYCIRAQKWLEAVSLEDPDGVAESFANSVDDGGLQAVVADLFLGYRVCPRGKTPSFGVGNVDATDAFTAHRLRDASHLRLVLRTEADKELVTQRPPLPALGEPPENPIPLADAIEVVRDAKLGAGWDEEGRWNPADHTLQRGPEYRVEQEGTEVLLARVRLPAAGDPPVFDVGGEIDVDNAIRVLSFTPHELSWLMRAT